uniref:Uncharacterized protein n=1 Tax=Arundo donax TaxID=35708 RepID=A0A0A9CEB0_ARUDO
MLLIKLNEIFKRGSFCYAML